MSRFQKWGILLRLLKTGSLQRIDLTFAESVLKKWGSDEEAHAALLATIFALSRLGHAALDIASKSLEPLGIETGDPFMELLRLGAATFPAQGIAENPQEKRPAAWICRFGSHFYLQKNWVYESEILFHLNRLSSASPTLALALSDTASGELNPQLNPLQRQAVAAAMRHCLSLLTGGPGTGKTFTAAEIVKACLASQPQPLKIVLAAPTGKGVAQLEAGLRKIVREPIAIRCGTLHAILGIKPHAEEAIQPLFADLIIVDECSMIDAKIFSLLLASIQTGARLVLIGDQDQLPPVETGSPFADLLDADLYPQTKLSQVLRSESQEILSLARSIREGNSDEAFALLSSGANIEWVDIAEEKSAQLYPFLWERCKDRFPSFFSEKPTPEQLLSRLGEFCILSCMRQGPLGVDAINGYFLTQFLKQTCETAWWVAPIMITRNDRELELFNGDLGFILRSLNKAISPREFDTSDEAFFFDRKGGFRKMPALALGAFEYNYCQSVHKSQGSEYDENLILAPQGSEVFGRQVLYTAVTRARKKVCIASSQTLLLQSIANSAKKSSGLRSRLTKK